jgi:hypothetical protein
MSDFCIIHCIQPTHSSPLSVISPTQRDSILLKTLGPREDVGATNQKVGGSTPLGRAIFIQSSSFSLFAAADRIGLRGFRN